VPFGRHCNIRPYQAEHTAMLTSPMSTYTVTIPKFLATRRTTSDGGWGSLHDGQYVDFANCIQSERVHHPDVGPLSSDVGRFVPRWHFVPRVDLVTTFAGISLVSIRSGVRRSEK
jgi:hypothetical protein